MERESAAAKPVAAKLKRLRRRPRLRSAALALIAAASCAASHAQNQQPVCDLGKGRFETIFQGVKVFAGAVENGGFAARACEATLNWENQHLLAAPPAAQVDIDVLGADLGFDVPVVAFQSRKADDDWQATYRVYSLDENPRLLATITGGDFYRAVDADFDQRISIWTTDAAAMEGFDGLTYSDFDFLPTIVLHFDDGRLMDVSPQYQAQYDRQIQQVRAQLTPQALDEFRRSDGRVAFGSVPGAELVRLRKIKVKVLEIVDAYLYSGRPDEAWAELTKDWPSSDVARAQAAIQAAHARGIDAQTVAVAPREEKSRRRHHPHIFDALKRPPPQNATSEMAVPGELGTMLAGVGTSQGSGTRVDNSVDSPPRAILMTRPPPRDPTAPVQQSREVLDLTLDAAGKVWAVKLQGKEAEPDLIEAAKQWKFIPARKTGQPVACLYQLQLAPYL